MNGRSARWRGPGSAAARSRLIALLLAGAAWAPLSAELQPAKGRFLVAERDLRDPNFSETVVLLTHYGEGGAMGLIVNWPTAAPAAELLPHVGGIAGLSDTIFVGGPVARQVLLMLLRSQGELEGAEHVFADVHLGTSRELLERVASGEQAVEEFRLYSGHAGWAPGQLELELAAGGWRVLPGEPGLVFDADPERVWSELMKRGEVQWTRRGGAAGERAAGPAQPRSSQSR